MKCKRCGATVTNDEADRVADSFDSYDDLCFPCAAECWKERQQDNAIYTPPQDEGG